jgi:hypothetical protein
MVISSYGAIFDFVDIHCGLNREEESFLKLEDLEIYRLSMKLGEKIWGLVETWDYFSKGTVVKLNNYINSINRLSKNNK